MVMRKLVTAAARQQIERQYSRHRAVGMASFKCPTNACGERFDHRGAAHVLRKSADNAALFETLQQFPGLEPAETTLTEYGSRSFS
jgi:hypothetical protein